MRNICFIPIDNRPVTYSLVFDIGALDKNIKILMPERRFLGGLVSCAQIDEILKTIKHTKQLDLIVLSLDTIAYGGLVSSRRGNETFDEIKERVLKLREIIKEKRDENPDLKVYATSSIMRISNNNVNEEEKEYWNKYGVEIFQYSYTSHVRGCTPSHNIPFDILDDYLNTRKRNFDINKLYLDFLEENIFDFLVFSKDDTGEFGLNVQEAEALNREINKRKLNAIIKTGADEIPLGLLCRGITENRELKIQTVFCNKNGIDKISRYEDISVKECVEAQIKLGVQNAKLVDNNPDIILYVNNFKEVQGDLVFQDVINENDYNFKTDIPYIIADINNANGADSRLINKFLELKLSPNFLSYAGWNTSANTIGSAVCQGLVAYFAKKEGNFDAENFKKLLAKRLLDDWAYQAVIRKNVRESGEFSKFLNENKNLFKPFEDRIFNFLGVEYKTEYKLPWDRSFEIEINLE